MIANLLIQEWIYMKVKGQTMMMNLRKSKEEYSRQYHHNSVQSRLENRNK